MFFYYFCLFVVVLIWSGVQRPTSFASLGFVALAARLDYVQHIERKFVWKQPFLNSIPFFLERISWRAAWQRRDTSRLESEVGT
jgi:uncharacterized membrane protein